MNDVLRGLTLDHSEYLKLLVARQKEKPMSTEKTILPRQKLTRLRVSRQTSKKKERKGKQSVNKVIGFHMVSSYIFHFGLLSTLLSP